MRLQALVKAHSPTALSELKLAYLSKLIQIEKKFDSFYLYYRVAAIFPEHFQSFTVLLKNNIFYCFFTQNHLSFLPKQK
jgi:hypothetical protein